MSLGNNLIVWLKCLHVGCWQQSFLCMASIPHGCWLPRQRDAPHGSGFLHLGLVGPFPQPLTLTTDSLQDLDCPRTLPALSHTTLTAVAWKKPKLTQELPNFSFWTLMNQFNMKWVTAHTVNHSDITDTNRQRTLLLRTIWHPVLLGRGNDCYHFYSFSEMLLSFTCTDVSPACIIEHQSHMWLFKFRSI